MRMLDRKLAPMNKRLPFTPNETDALLYVIISVLLLMSVNQVLSQPQMSRQESQLKNTYLEQQSCVLGLSERFFLSSNEKDFYQWEVVNTKEARSKIKFASSESKSLIGVSSSRAWVRNRPTELNYFVNNFRSTFRDIEKKFVAGSFCRMWLRILIMSKNKA
jgi:hypothetical protein